MDRIGREGAVLTQCFAATPVCSPARASIMTSGVDFSPTMCAIAGAKPPTGQIIRGHDFSPLLRGEKIAWDNDLYAEYSQHHYTTAGLRMWRTPRYKLVRDFLNAGRDELYDLTSDPDENHNLIASADPAIRQIRTQLDARLLGQMRVINDPIIQRPGAKPLPE